MMPSRRLTRKREPLHIDQWQVRCAHWKRHPLEFGRVIGGSLKRHKIELDPWQAGILTSRHPRILLNTSRQAGKSTITAAIALYRAMLFDESEVIIVAPTERQAKITFAKISRFYLGIGGQIAAKSVRKMGLEFNNGSLIEALPGNPDGVRGYSPHLLILDEAAYMEDALYEALRPSLGASEGDLIALSTPNGRQGWFYEAWENGTGWERYRVPATECSRISERFLAEEREALPDYKFRQEYLCEFTATDDALFDSSSIERSYGAFDWTPVGVSVFSS